MTINVSGLAIELSAPTGGLVTDGNIFLIADAETNAVREYLLLFQDTLGYRPPNALLFDRLSDPFVLAVAQQQIPEPATLALLGLGLLGIGFARRRTQ